MARKEGPATIVRLSQPVQDGPREVSELYLAGKPGGIALPATPKGEETEIDALAVEQIIAQRAAMSVAAVRKLSAVDLVTVFFVLFRRPGGERQEPKKKGKK